MTLYMHGRSIISIHKPQGDNVDQNLGFNILNSNSDAISVAGYFKFSGRYISGISIKQSVNNQNFSLIDASEITVTRIVGYQNA